MELKSSTQGHHPFSIISATLRFLWLLFLCQTAWLPKGTSQEITGLELIRTLSHINYSVHNFDVYFENGLQLIAYSNTSGGPGNDTLVVYDYVADQVLFNHAAPTWSFDIAFVNGNHLLFSNNGKLFRISNIIFPVVTEVTDGVITFSLSDDHSTVALLKNSGVGYLIELSAYNSNTGTLSSPATYEFTDVLDHSNSKIAMSPDGQYLAINGGYDNDYVILINTNTGSVTTINTPDNQGTYSPAFYESSGSLFLAVGGGYLNGSIEIIDVGSLSHELSIPVFNFYNYALAFDSSMEYVATGGYDGILKVFHVSGTEFDEVAMTSAGNINKVMFTQDNEYVVLGEGPSNAALKIYRVIRGGTGTETPVEIHGGLFPNPASDVLFLQNDYVNMEIYDLRGIQVLELATSAKMHDISQLTAGSYFIRAIHDKGIHLMRFTKL